jgi:diadenosine tetraphosphate (Ap4A) HIT family hydrolase
MSAPPQCPFCTSTPDRVFHEGMLIRGLWDGFPVSNGHALLVTRRHVPTWFDATDAERSELMASVAIARRAIEASRQPDGFNIGVNVGTAAGQTVSHLHVHVIPRYLGDVPDPRGGVRWVLPSTANYLVARDAGADDRHGAAAMYGDLAEAAAMDLLSTGD